MSLVIPSGYKAIFHMSAAPVGWTKDTTNNNSMLRVVSGSVSSGGSIDFSSAFTSSVNLPVNLTSNSSSITISNHTILLAEIPAHTHVANGSITNTSQIGSFFDRSPETGTALTRSNTYITKATSLSSGGSVAHTHSSGNLLFGLSSTSINLDMNVKYVDVIRATRN